MIGAQPITGLRSAATLAKFSGEKGERFNLKVEYTALLRRVFVLKCVSELIGPTSEPVAEAGAEKLGDRNETPPEPSGAGMFRISSDGLDAPGLLLTTNNWSNVKRRPLVAVTPDRYLLRLFCYRGVN